MEDVKARLKKKAELIEEEAQIKMKQELERVRKEAIKRNFASTTSKILIAKKRLMRNSEAKTDVLP